MRPHGGDVIDLARVPPRGLPGSPGDGRVRARRARQVRSAPAKIAELGKALEARTKLLADADAAIREPVHAKIREMQADQERRAGGDDTWWRIELGFLWNDMVDAYDADVAVRRKPDVRAQAKALVERSTQATLTVRREVRQVHDLAAGAPFTDQRNELWSKTMTDLPLEDEPSQD